MTENIEESLFNILTTADFNLQLDESALAGDESLLFAYVCFDKDESVVQQDLIKVFKNVSYFCKDFSISWICICIV